MIGRIVVLAVACGVAAAAAGATPQSARNGLIAFSREQGDNISIPEIYVISAGGSKRKRISREGAWGPPSWSPNGRAIAFPTIDDVAIARVDGRTQRKLHVPRSLGTGADVSWSPDGRGVAFVDESGPLYVKSLGGRLRRLSHGEAQSPSWSPSSRQIAYVLTRQDESDVLMVVGATGRGRRRLINWGWGREPGPRPSWSPDGRQIVVANRGIAVLDVRTGRSTRITRRNSDFGPIWSPDGSRIAFQRQRGKDDFEIFSIHPDRTGLTRLTRNRENEAWLAWSPTGRRLGYVGRNGDVFLVGRDGGRARRISRQLCGEGAHWLAWSPRGGQLAFGSSPYGRDAEIFTSKSSGADLKQVTDNCTFNESDPAWSPDGGRIAYDRATAGGKRHIYVMDRNGSDARRVTSGLTIDTDPSWSPDATRLAFSGWRKPGDAELFTIRADGTDERQLTDTPGFNYLPDWSPQGDKIAFTRTGNDSGIYVMNADGSRAVRLADGLAPAWSPDGTRIAFVKGYNIWTMKADGTDQVRLTQRDGYTEALWPSWSPDGTKIAFSGDIDGGRGSQYGLFVVDAADGTPRTLLYENQDNLQPDWQALP